MSPCAGSLTLGGAGPPFNLVVGRLRVPVVVWELEKSIPILCIAKELGVQFASRKQAFCFSGHDSKTPSLSFDSARNLWHCFGCGLGGTNIDLVLQVRKCSARQAAEWIRRYHRLDGTSLLNADHLRNATADRSLEQGPEERTTLHQPDPEIYSWLLTNAKITKSTVDMLCRTRGLSSATIHTFGLGELRHTRELARQAFEKWGKERLSRAGLIRAARPTNAFGRHNESRFLWWDHTLLIPFFHGGQVQYVQGRRFSCRQPKYVGLASIEKPLFNGDILNLLPPGERVLVCEGVTDALAASELGYNAVGVLGASSFRFEWAKTLSIFDVHVVPDNDDAGRRFAESIQEALAAFGRGVTVLKPSHGKDLSEDLMFLRNTRAR